MIRVQLLLVCPFTVVKVVRGKEHPLNFNICCLFRVRVLVPLYPPPYLRSVQRCVDQSGIRAR